MTVSLLRMQDLSLSGKRVLIREDLNVPIDDGVITSEERILRALPTLRKALKQGAAVIVLSHLGRPTEGRFDQGASLALVAESLSQHLGQTVRLEKDYLQGLDVEPGQLVLCENVRFNQGETANDEKLSEQLAALCDVVVMDAFATAHRAHASTVGVINKAPMACAGPLLMEELHAFDQAMTTPKKPLVAIVGGSKVSTKIQVLSALLEKVDTLLVGGGIANTFLAAKGYAIGQSLYEADWVDRARKLLDKAVSLGVDIPLPVDVAVANEFSHAARATIKPVAAVGEQDMILDVGPETAATYSHLMSTAGTIVWNGPVGVFEFPEFEYGTRQLALAVTNSSAYKVAGGGDTVAALDVFHLSDKMNYISTGGGAFLALLEGQTLPVVEALQHRVKDHGNT